MTQCARVSALIINIQKKNGKQNKNGEKKVQFSESEHMDPETLWTMENNVNINFAFVAIFGFECIICYIQIDCRRRPQ